MFVIDVIDLIASKWQPPCLQYPRFMNTKQIDKYNHLRVLFYKPE